MTKQKLLLYQPYYNRKGHFNSYFEQLFSKISNRGFECYGVIGYDQSGTISRNTHPNVSSFFYSVNSHYQRILANWKGLRRLQKLCIKKNIEVIHLLDIEIFILFLFVAFNIDFFRKRKLIITQHSVNHYIARSSLLYQIYQWLARKSFRFVSTNLNFQCITNGSYISKTLIDLEYISQDKLITAGWASDGKITGNIGKESNTFLLFGILRSDKNLEYVLEAFSTIENYTLIIAGYPEAYSVESINRLLKKYGISPEQYKLYLKYISEEQKDRLFELSEFTLIPYGSENLSNSGPLLTAIQHLSIPIVSDYGVRSEIITTHSCGYLFDFEDRPLSKVLLTALQNEEMNERFRNKMNSIKENFTWNSYVNRLIEAGIYTR